MKIRTEKIGNKPNWIARITGIDDKYGYKREFIYGEKDYTQANSVRSRGVYITYTLGDGVYEINIPTSWKATTRKYIKVDGDNSIDITAEVLDEILKTREMNEKTKKTAKKEEPKNKMLTRSGKSYKIEVNSDYPTYYYYRTEVEKLIKGLGYTTIEELAKDHRPEQVINEYLQPYRIRKSAWVGR